MDNTLYYVEIWAIVVACCFPNILYIAGSPITRSRLNYIAIVIIVIMGTLASVYIYTL